MAYGQNIRWYISLYAAVCYVFVPFLTEYSKNIEKLNKMAANSWFMY